MEKRVRLVAREGGRDSEASSPVVAACGEALTGCPGRVNLLPIGAHSSPQKTLIIASCLQPDVLNLPEKMTVCLQAHLKKETLQGSDHSNRVDCGEEFKVFGCRRIYEANKPW